MPAEGALEAHEGPWSQVGGGLRASWEGEEGHGETMWWSHRSSSPAGQLPPQLFSKKDFFDASLHLNNRVCPSLGGLACLSVYRLGAQPLNLLICF